MNYEETIELEENIKIKNKANELYKLFLSNVKLSVKDFSEKENRFCVWSDSHNAKYIAFDSHGRFVFQCRFLHESYDLTVTPSYMFDAMKNEYRVLDHFESFVKHGKF